MLESSDIHLLCFHQINLQHKQFKTCLLCLCRVPVIQNSGRRQRLQSFAAKHTDTSVRQVSLSPRCSPSVLSWNGGGRWEAQVIKKLIHSAYKCCSGLGPLPLDPHVPTLGSNPTGAGSFLLLHLPFTLLSVSLTRKHWGLQQQRKLIHITAHTSTDHKGSPSVWSDQRGQQFVGCETMHGA